MGSTRSQRDDDTHAVVSKAHPLAQTSVEAFLGYRHDQRDRPTPPRSRFGTYEVKELDVKSALTDCQLPGRCWSLNPYTGCSHDCTYCYVPDVAHLERDRWGSYVIVKRNLPRKLEHELKRKARRQVFLSSATDPYQPVEDRHEITRRCLELLAREDWPVRVLTRSPLVQRDIDLLERFSDLTVGLSIPTIDDEARKLIEPAAPPIEGRLATVHSLAQAGLEPFINLAPAYPLMDGTRADDLAQRFAKAGASAVYAGRWRYLDDFMHRLHERVDDTVYEALTRAVKDETYYDRLIASLRGAFRRVEVPFEPM